MQRRTFLKSAVACGAAMAIPLHARARQVVGGHAFGSYWRITTAQPVDTAVLSDRVADIVARVDAAMSPYRTDTEISRLNTIDTTDWIALSGDMTTVLKTALETSRRTNGAFDPTVGGIVGQYGFGPIRGERVGSAADLTLLDGTLRKGHGGITVDLCGIAKGWALDLIVADLSANGISDALVELGGEVAALGRHPDGRAWRVAIDGPQPLAMQLSGCAVATSGNTPQGYRVGTARYGHIIDPHLGTAATGDLLSVSVVSPNAMQADALATALFASGFETAGALAQSLGLDAVMLMQDGDAIRPMTFGSVDQQLM